jgi:hypothetical protein
VTGSHGLGWTMEALDRNFQYMVAEILYLLLTN